MRMKSGPGSGRTGAHNGDGSRGSISRNRTRREKEKLKGG